MVWASAMRLAPSHSLSTKSNQFYKIQGRIGWTTRQRPFDTLFNFYRPRYPWSDLWVQVSQRDLGLSNFFFKTLADEVNNMRKYIFSTASGALVVGGVRDICSSSSIDGWIDPGDRFECSMEYNQSVSGSLW